MSFLEKGVSCLYINFPREASFRGGPTGTIVPIYEICNSSVSEITEYLNLLLYTAL